MENKSEELDIELICAIVNFGSASKLIKMAKRCGISAGTVVLGIGTKHSGIGLSDIRREIVFLVTDKATAYSGLEELNKTFEFYKANRGIAFTSSICDVSGTKNISCKSKKNERGADEIMYQVITVIVERGKGAEVIDAAVLGGSKGGTIINARGSGIHETKKVFGMEIEPEREIVMILSELGSVESIVSSIKKSLKIDEPDNGIIYVQNVNNTYGVAK